MECEFSIIIPAYNEDGVIGETLRYLQDFLQGRFSYEIIVVDDGSQDQTCQIVEELALKHPSILLYREHKNQGKGMAVKKGILNSRGKVVFYTDADLPYSIQMIFTYIKAIRDGADIAVGCRAHKESYYNIHQRYILYILSRHLIGMTYIRIVRTLMGLDMRDTQCAFKCLRGAVARDLFSRVRRKGFSFEVEVLLMAIKKELCVIELPVIYKYKGEKSHVIIVRDSLKMLLDLLLIKYDFRRGKYRI